MRQVSLELLGVCRLCHGRGRDIDSISPQLACWKCYGRGRETYELDVGDLCVKRDDKDNEVYLFLGRTGYGFWFVPVGDVPNVAKCHGAHIVARVFMIASRYEDSA